MSVTRLWTRMNASNLMSNRETMQHSLKSRGPAECHLYKHKHDFLLHNFTRRIALLYSSSEEISACVFATTQMSSGAWFALGLAPMCLNVTAEWLGLWPSAQAEQQGGKKKSKRTGRCTSLFAEFEVRHCTVLVWGSKDFWDLTVLCVRYKCGNIRW